MTTKITTWNVNGLRAVMSRGDLAWIKEYMPDILCLQEIKTRPEQLRDEHRACFDGYHDYWNPAERLGYSGVATFTRQEPVEMQWGLREPRFDVEGRVILTRHPGFLLFNVYFPSGQRGMDRVGYKLEFYSYLLDVVDRLHQGGEKVIICGDFNTAHQEIDLRNPKQNQKTSGFLPEERAWIDTYLSHGLMDAFRLLYPDRIQYTWWTYRMGARERNIGWRLDYFLVSGALMPRVQEVTIHNELPGSDHCPVTLALSDE